MAPNLIGYASEAQTGSSLDKQVARLVELGCDPIFTDTGKKPAQGFRPGLVEALAAAAFGDTLIVCDAARLARNIHDHIAIQDALSARGIDLLILEDESVPGL